MFFLYALLSQRLHFDQCLWVVFSRHWCGVMLCPPNIGTSISSSHLTAWTQPSTKTTNPVVLGPAGLNISTMTGDTVVWRGLTRIKQAASRAPPGNLHGPRNQRLLNFHHTAGSARVSKSAVIRPSRRLQSRVEFHKHATQITPLSVSAASSTLQQ